MFKIICLTIDLIYSFLHVPLLINQGYDNQNILMEYMPNLVKELLKYSIYTNVLLFYVIKKLKLQLFIFKKNLTAQILFFI